ncbi:two-component system sensor histidine kinase KdpD [Herbaspirillum sp. Sphag1AN]|uniref:sensor histidine kinase n=1 Tax=unclassified Herbaspirillum TaxID=2624150 RepID=UPI001609C503|nr:MULTISPECIES: sensor histidine kinase KdpD [unclassified Herbaspirillum]MBB3211416.1 two-component system sensor histidine kinase KdpD [Herbaspirillum sp. Sphag1AN]MBB3245317.1 two-component system sensor histidine kinase KdpD [Herbaspirillum sp. Sphag64]
MINRPDPDELLDRVMREEDRQARGRLKIFFGASAGVGKTYSMLAAAQTLHEQGVDVVAGIVETHGRADTEAMLQGLERLPLRTYEYRGRALSEFDLDAALERQPYLILVDELAHSNIPDSRHAKRWQDIEELLHAGINVYTTVNVQHLESLNDVVGQITGIRVQETIPDHVIDDADEVTLVDLPPDELLLRLKEGKVYLPQQAEKASRNFFRKGNLLALREIALRRTADRVDADMRAYRADRSIAQLWQTKERIVVGIGTSADEDKLVRAAARLAAKLQADWLAVFVDAPSWPRATLARRERMLKTLKLAQSLGAETASITGDDVAQALVQFARSRNAGKLVIGQSRRRNWFKRLRTSLTERIALLGEEIDVYAVAREDKEEPAGPRDPLQGEFSTGSQRRRQGYLWASISCAVTTALAWWLIGFLHPANVIMVYLVGVMIVAVRYGRSASALASVLSVLAFDFFFVEPRFSISVSDAQYLVTLLVMLAASLFISTLASRLRHQANVAMLRETRSGNLYMLGKELAAVLTLEQILEIGRRHLGAVFGAKTAFLLPDSSEHVRVAIPNEHDPHTLDEVDLGVAQWVYDNGQPAGSGTATLPAAEALYLPLNATMRTRGVLAFISDDNNAAGRNTQLALPENRQMLEIFASQIAMAVERLHYAEVAQDALLTMESERLRNSLLSAISHDLRTPLTSLVGSADALASHPSLGPDERAMAQVISEQSQRMSGLVENMLDMARLQSGGVTLNRQWNAIEEVVGTALRLLQKTLGERKVEVHLPVDLPLVRFDAVLLERVFANLIENAVKYSPGNQPILIEAHAVPGYPGTLDIDVIDHGPGFPPGMEERVFEKFTRGDSESSTPGVGLGLAICRAIVEAHGGTIRALPNDAQRPGAHVRFTLPLEKTPALPEED